MNIASSPVSASSVNATPGSNAEAAQVLVLKKAMDLQKTNAAALLQALPQPVALATSGAIGRNVNAWA
jgi:Putative motility protein